MSCLFAVQVITPTNGDPTPELELYPISLRLFRHAPPPTRGGITTWTGVGFGLSTFGFGTNSLTTPHAPPKRYLAYVASFSRMNTIQQVNLYWVLLKILCNRILVGTATEVTKCTWSITIYTEACLSCSSLEVHWRNISLKPWQFSKTCCEWSLWCDVSCLFHWLPMFVGLWVSLCKT